MGQDGRVWGWDCFFQRLPLTHSASLLPLSNKSYSLLCQGAVVQITYCIFYLCWRWGQHYTWNWRWNKIVVAIPFTLHAYKETALINTLVISQTRKASTCRQNFPSLFSALQNKLTNFNNLTGDQVAKMWQKSSKCFDPSHQQDWQISYKHKI